MEHCDSNGTCVMPDSPVSSYHSTDNLYAELNRSESAQDKNVKEARTKCRTIASLLTDAPNPHSKGVLMFKKRRQRAKKYTLVSYGSVDEDRYIEDEDGVLPTSESEFDEEGFSDARSLTNNSDWDSTYMDIEKSKMEHETQEEKGLTDVSGKGAALFELQRQKSEQAAESAPLQNPQEHHKTPVAPPRKSVANGNVTQMVNYDKSQETRSSESTKVTSTQISLTPAYSNDPQAPGSGNAIFNRSARPFTPGQVGQRAMASSVSFKPSTPKIIENFPVQNVASSAFTPFTADSPANPQKTPVSSVASLFIPAPGRTVSPAPQYHENHKENHLAPTTPRTTTASIYLSSPSRPSGPHTVTSQSNISQSNPVSPSTSTVSQFISPAPITSSYISPVTQVNQSPECVNSREQRISVPIGRTGILNEARKRGGRKQMFVKKEEKKIMPNPELLSMVKNIDEKPKQEQHVAGFESGPEEDFLSLGAEACNFMQSSARKLKVPPPVAPKPNFKTTAEQLVNGSSDLPQLKGKGAELFAKRQSRMDKFVVDSDHRSSSRPNSRPRTPSPTPSLPSSWKYSSNIRAPPPIGYNPLVSPFCPLAASKTQGGKADSKVKKGTPGKPRMQAIDFMRHKPYQLNSAMFCFGDSSNSPDTPKMSSTLSRQVPVKTRAHEIKRFSTPTPMSSVNMTPTVLTPRSATTLAEPVWRSDVSCQPMPTKVPGPAPFYASVQETPQRNMESSVISPTNSFTSPRSVSTIQVPKPRFSAAKTGMQANVWRPAKVHF